MFNSQDKGVTVLNTKQWCCSCQERGVRDKNSRSNTPLVKRDFCQFSWAPNPAWSSGCRKTAFPPGSSQLPGSRPSRALGGHTLVTVHFSHFSLFTLFTLFTFHTSHLSLFSLLPSTCRTATQESPLRFKNPPVEFTKLKLICKLVSDSEKQEEAAPAPTQTEFIPPHLRRDVLFLLSCF